MARYTHYTSAGQTLTFACYDAELDKWCEGDTKPAPRRISNLTKVTCPQCWKYILAMAYRQRRLQRRARPRKQ